MADERANRIQRATQCSSADQVGVAFGVAYCLARIRAPPTAPLAFFAKPNVRPIVDEMLRRLG